MPPRTDCSAGISCGGFRLASDPRVASTGSRCAIDKVAVLHVSRTRGPGGYPSWCGVARRPRTATCSGLPAGCDNAGPGPPEMAWRGLSPLSTGFPQRAISSESRGSAGCPSAALWNQQEPEEQVPRYASPPGSCCKAKSVRTLWTTCALRGIACAQPVGKAVDSKKVSLTICP